MTSRIRRLPLALVGLLVLVVPLLGVHPAQGAGTGSPVIVSPADGESYHVEEVPDLHLDFSDAPYGGYRFEVTDSSDAVVLDGDIDHTEAIDPQVYYELPELGLDAYTVTVFGAADAVLATATFGTFDLGEPPLVCSVDLPEKVVAVSPTTVVYPTYDGCGSATASWYVDGPGSFKAARIGLDSGRSLGPWRFRDSDRPGRFAADPQDLAPPGLELSGDSAVVKFGSRISLVAGTRTPTRVPLTGVASRYSPIADGFRRWADRPVAISYKDCAACPWTFLAMDRTDSTGAFGLTVISTRTRYYRATVGETATAWGRTSQPVRR